MNHEELTLLWQDQASLTEVLSEEQQDWLFNEASLTKRLTSLSHGQFAVNVLLEEWQSLRKDEYQKLGISAAQPGWVREVLLLGQGEPWVYARSVAMQTELNNAYYNLTNIGSKSLGSILFSDDSFHRTPLELVRYPMELLPPELANSNLWGRRSCFINQHLNIIVQEVFLPCFWQQLASISN